jgi:hypothetical protein
LPAANIIAYLSRGIETKYAKLFVLGKHFQIGVIYECKAFKIDQVALNKSSLLLKIDIQKTQRIIKTESICKSY